MRAVIPQGYRSLAAEAAMAGVAGWMRKKKTTAVAGWVIVCTVLVGTEIGQWVLTVQFTRARVVVETLASELVTVQRLEGSFPQDLTRLAGHDPSGCVPVGLWRKRPLHYAITRKGRGFRLWFPYRAFQTAEYDHTSGGWYATD